MQIVMMPVGFVRRHMGMTLNSRGSFKRAPRTQIPNTDPETGHRGLPWPWACVRKSRGESADSVNYWIGTGSSHNRWASQSRFASSEAHILREEPSPRTVICKREPRDFSVLVDAFVLLLELL
jgi:hypothetical protein